MAKIITTARAGAHTFRAVKITIQMSDITLLTVLLECCKMIALLECFNLLQCNLTFKDLQSLQIIYLSVCCMLSLGTYLAISIDY